MSSEDNMNDAIDLLGLLGEKPFTVHASDGCEVYATSCESTAFGEAQDLAMGVHVSCEFEVRFKGDRIGAYRVSRGEVSGRPVRVS